MACLTHSRNQDSFPLLCQFLPLLFSRVLHECFYRPYRFYTTDGTFVDPPLGSIATFWGSSAKSRNGPPSNDCDEMVLQSAYGNATIALGRSGVAAEDVGGKLYLLSVSENWPGVGSCVGWIWRENEEVE